MKGLVMEQREGSGRRTIDQVRDRHIDKLTEVNEKLLDSVNALNISVTKLNSTVANHDEMVVGMKLTLYGNDGTGGIVGAMSTHTRKNDQFESRLDGIEKKIKDSEAAKNAVSARYKKIRDNVLVVAIIGFLTTVWAKAESIIAWLKN